MPRFVVRQQSSLTKKSTQLKAIAVNALPLIEQVLAEIAEEVIQEAIDNYDTAEEGESYVRTGELGLHWDRTEPTDGPGGSIQVLVTNDVVDPYGRFYAGLVQGDFQTERHRDAGWRKIDDIQHDHSHEQANKVRAAIRRAGRV